MASRHDIIHIDFEANAGKASPALKALRDASQETSNKIAEVNKRLEELRKSGAAAETIAETEKELKTLNKELNAFDKGAKELVKGVDMLSKGIEAFNNGTLDKMSAAFNKAVFNAAKLAATKISPDTEKGRKDIEEMNALMLATEKNVLNAKRDFDELTKTIASGGSVGVTELRQAKTDLKELTDLAAYGSEEWKGYKTQLDAVSNKLNSISETERRMAGDVVTVNDAMRLSNNLTQEAIEKRQLLARAEKQEATEARENIERSLTASQQRLETAEKELPIVEQELEKQKELAEALEKTGKLRHELAQAKDERQPVSSEYFKEKGEWLRLNDEEIKSQVKVDELKEKLDETSDTRKKRHVRKEIRNAEIELTQAREKSAAQAEKLRLAEEKLAQANEKVAKIEKEIAAIMGDLDYDTEKEKLDDLTAKHADLTQTLTQEKQTRDGLAQATASAQQRERDAAIELAQAEHISQQSMEDALSILEKTHKKTGEGTVEYHEQAKAIEELKQRLNEMKGEWMSFNDAQDLASKAGGEGFIATSQQMQQATAALERHRDSLIKTIQQKKKDEQATDAEEKELKDLEKQLKDLKFEQDNFNMSHAKMEALLKEPKKATDLDELKAAIKRADGELHRMEQSLGTNNKLYQEFASKVKSAKVELKQMEDQSKGTASAFDKAWSRLKTYVGQYMGAAVAIQKLTATLGDLMELSDKMGEVRKTTDFSEEQVGRLSDELKKLDTRTALTGLMDLSVAAGQLSLKTEEDVLGFTEAANKLMVALPEMGKEGATEMLKVALATGEIDKIRRQMEQGLIDGSSATAVAMEKVGSTIDRLRATSAATAPAITDFVKRVGAVGAQSGISIDQVAALGSTVDALGMRVEMSATALSRMMPAIKNNAFDIAKILGVTPNTIRELYDTGQGMEVILMILQRMKDSNMDADSIEQMLGMGGMKEIMKELSQQGARAGIVFGGLSQNVDELRRQLGVAKQAYEENIAIQNEYNKMNETTPAKWERLKNQIEELFVGDQSQQWLGKIIDGLRWIVDFLTGNVGPALRLVSGLVHVLIVYGAALKLEIGAAFISAGGAFKNFGIAIGAAINSFGIFTRATANARAEWKKLDAAMKANIWGAVIAAVTALGFALYHYIDSLREAGREAAKFQAELDKEQRKVNELTNSIGEARVKIEDANKEVAKARAELDAAKKANDGTTEAVNRLTKAESELLVKEEAKKNAMAAHKQLITEFNNQYSKYLGFMLSEVSSNLELARARDLVNSKLRETLILKQREAGLQRVEESAGKGRDKAYSNMYDMVYDRIKDPTQAARMVSDLTKAAQKQDEKAIHNILVKNGYASGLMQKAVRDYQNELKNVETERNKVIAQSAAQYGEARADSQGGLISQTNASFSNYNRLLRRYRGSKGDNRARNAAAVLQQMDMLEDIRTNASTYYDMTDPKEAAIYRKQFGAFNAWKGYDRNTLLKEAGRYYTPRKKMQPGGGSGSGGSFTTSDRYTSGYSGNSIWGNEVDAASTDYSTWDVTELVARRNQMDKFKNVLKPGIEIRKVLAEDRALMKAIDEKKVGEDWQSVLEWYNAERLKIQQELKSERHSTNQGNWRDETDKSGRKRRVNPLIESDYALAELDRYYSRRKEALEKARSEENISEELYNRQAEMLEQEHLERRSKLRGTFTGEVSKEETAAFRKWWADLEKMDELDHVPWATVESEWSKALAAQIGRNNLKRQQDLTQMESITMKHVNQIAKIISKERPYDGITENLQANLTKMDILFADLGTVTKKQLEDGSLTKELGRRMSFLLDETERAYSLTAEQLMSDMGANGFKAWADAIANAKNADELKRQLLAQLQKAYDAVQDAIKKETSLIKKQAEIQWNDTKLAGGISQKNFFEAALSALGLQEDQVKRANQLIGAGQASERVADKLAIKQMELRLEMQTQYYALIKKIGDERIAQLEKAGELEDAAHLRKSLDLALSEELKKKEEQRVAIQNQLEESQDRLYKRLREWGELIAGSVQSMFEASHAGDKEYYNERAKMALTGKGGPGAGTYVVIDNAGTSGAEAHYEHLNERQALERQHEIERQNAMAEAWKKVMDDINMKMSETITDQINAMLQNASINANTDATNANTQAIIKQTEMLANSQSVNTVSGGELPVIDESNPDTWGRAARKRAGLPVDQNPHDFTQGGDMATAPAENMGLVDAYLQEDLIEKSNAATQLMIENSNKLARTQTENDKKTVKSSQSMFAKMTQAANLYGIAYQAMSNDNLSSTQKFEMIAVQAAGQAGIAALTAAMSKSTGQTAANMPAIASESFKINPIAGAAIFAAITAVLGGLLGMAVSKIAKSKSEIAQATGVGASAGKLTTGMLTYAEGNVNEFTDPSTLREGRMYNVDSADGHTYRARYMGRNPKTHITNGPEFHLSGERGKEMIIDAGTTRQITMNDTEIWRAIQTLSSGRRMAPTRRRSAGRGVAAFADGNVDDFMDADAIGTEGTGLNIADMEQMRMSLDRNSAVQEALLERLSQPIQAKFDVHGPGGLVDSYDRGKKTAVRHGERY